MSPDDMAVKTATMIAAIGGTGAAFDWLNSDITVPIFGVSAIVVGAAVGGSALSLAFGEPVKKRSALFAQVLLAAGLAATLVAIGPRVSDSFLWVSDLQGPSAVVTGALLRIFMPTIIDKGKDLIKTIRIPFISGKSEKPNE